MERVDRGGRRVQVGIRERRLVVHDRGRNYAWRDDERLDAEAADEVLVALSLAIGLDIALVPRQAKGPVVRKKSDSGLENGFFTQRFSQAGIHDGDRRESMSSQRGNRLECYVAEIEVQPSAKFGRA